MAAIFPPWACDPACLPADSRMGIVREHQTLQRLRAALPDSYTIFHSTHLAWVDDSRLHKREADFLVVNRAGQVLMVEMKTGPLEETAGGLVKAYGDARKPVVAQLHDVTDALRQRFREAHGVQARLDIRFLLYCPDHALRDFAAAGLTRQQLVDARDRHALPQAIRRLLPDGPRDEAQFDRVRRMLAQELHLDPDRAALAEQGQQLVTRLTGDLLDFLGALEMSPFRLRVDGAAGCGKTQMVSFFAERARAAGKRALVACFNRPLADELRGAVPEEARVDTLHGLARRLLEAAVRAPDMRGANDPGFWRTLVASATDLALEGVPEEFLFDALVVDEGQDIDQDGYELLKLLLRPGADVVWLEDENQRLYGGRPLSEPGFVLYRCRDNHRSPQRIARFLQALLPFHFEARNPLQGDAVQIVEAQPASLLDRLSERVERLVMAGYAPGQIVVLTGRGLQGSVAMKAESLAGHPTRRLAGYDADGGARFTEGALRVETLWRFKGQQAPAVVLCELDGDPADADLQRRLYVAATRATQRLEILLPKASALLATVRRAAAQV